MELKVDGGVLRVIMNDDDNYPGIDIEYIPNDYDGKVTLPRVCMEKPKGDDYPRVLIWACEDEEDYTYEVNFERGEMND